VIVMANDLQYDDPYDDATISDWPADPAPSSPVVSGETSGTSDADEKVTLWFGNAEEWVRCWFRWAWQHKVDAHSTYWDPEWWQLNEPVARLTVMWLAWEAARQAGADMSVWWINTCDPHMRELTSGNGPFRRSEYKRLGTTEPLMLTVPPKDHPLRKLEPHLAHLTSGCPDGLGVVEQFYATFHGPLPDPAVKPVGEMTRYDD